MTIFQLAKIKTALVRTSILTLGIIGTLGLILFGPLSVHAATPSFDVTEEITRKYLLPLTTA